MDNTSSYHPCVVITFNSATDYSAIEWLRSRIKNSCNLQVQLSDEDKILYVTASRRRLLEGAEQLGLKKEYEDRTFREFSIANAQHFKNSGDDEFLAESENHYIIKTLLDGLRAVDETHIPGHPSVKLYPGKSILHRMKSSLLIAELFPLHNRTTLHNLRMVWYKNNVNFLSSIHEVQRYFGEAIGIYFAFLNFYTVSLFPLAVLSLIQWYIGEYVASMHEVDDNWHVSVIHVFWSAIFVKLWKRRSVLLLYKWGGVESAEWEEPRSAFKGKLGVNEITQHQEPVYPNWKRNIRRYLISYPAVFACLVMSVALMFWYFHWEFYYLELYRSDDSLFATFMKNMPSVIYSVIVLVASVIYRHIAYALTNQENHRLESTFQNHLITKILLFDFVNSFLCLFYTAFVYKDIHVLRTTLRNLLLVHMIISQIVESVLPYWQYKWRSLKLKNSSKRKEVLLSDEKAELPIHDQIKLELQRENYLGTFEDYLELWLQYGYVILFSCAYPPAAIFAVLNNLIEIRSDAFKMCNVFKRPFPYQTYGTGAWEIAFSALSYLAIITNLALILQSPEVLKWLHKLNATASSFTIFVIFIFLEHLLLLLRWLIEFVIPDTPDWLTVQKSKLKYTSLQALKCRRSTVSSNLN